MTYYHWAAEPVKLHRTSYPQSGHPKPNGLWFDVNGSWKQWCEATRVHLQDLCYRHTVTIYDASRVLFLRNAKDIDAFTLEYRHDMSDLIQPLQNSEDIDAFAGQYGQDLFSDIQGQFSNYIL